MYYFFFQGSKGKAKIPTTVRHQIINFEFKWQNWLFIRLSSSIIGIEELQRNHPTQILQIDFNYSELVFFLQNGPIVSKIADPVLELLIFINPVMHYIFCGKSDDWLYSTDDKTLITGYSYNCCWLILSDKSNKLSVR